MTAATLEAVLSAVNVQHQRIPMFDGGGGQRCVGCDSLHGETDGPNSPRHAEHVAIKQAAAVRSWLTDRLADEGLRRSVAEVMAEETAHMVAPTYIAEATAALAAVTAALTEGDGDE